MEIIPILERFGFPIAMLMITLWGVYRIAWWAADRFNWFSEHIIVPVTTRHLKFMDEVSVATDKMGEAVDRITTSQQVLVDHMVTLQAAIRTNSRRVGVLERGAEESERS